MTSPLSKLVLQSAAKFKLSSEAKALLMTQSALNIVKDMLPAFAKDASGLKIAYRQETLFIKSASSALSSELHMRRMTLLHRLQATVPHIPCKFVIVHGVKK